MIKKLNTLVIARSEATRIPVIANEVRQSTHRLLALMTVFALVFVGLTAITGPTQQAQADAQSDYYNMIATRWDTDNPVKVNFCGFNWIVVGINDGSNSVGVGTIRGDSTDLPIGNATLLLDKSNTILGLTKFDDDGNAQYIGSYFQNVMNVTIYNSFSSCTERGDITNRDLPQLEGYGVPPITEINQSIWPLSYQEANQLTVNERLFPQSPGDWWLRTWRARVNGSGVADCYNDSCAAYHFFTYNVRPALYISLSSAVFSQLPDLTTQYLTHFDLKDGGGTVGDKYITTEIPTSLPNYSGTKYGYDFKGWDTDPSADTVEYTYGQQVTNLTTTGSTITLYAVWQAKVSDITVDPTETTITFGKTANLASTITASETTYSNVTWSSSNNTVATVNATGTVTPVAVGDTTITVKSDSNTLKYATTTVHIVQQPETAPTLALDYTNETVTGFDTDTTGFRVAGTEGGLTGASCAQVVTGTSDIASTITNSSKTLWTKKCATDGNHSDSTTTSIVILARPVAPTISATAPSLYGLGDGYVGGLTTNEEWNAISATYDGVWTQVTGTSVDNLSAGDKVCVRTVAEAGVKFKSLGSCVTVGQGVAPVNSVSVTPSAITLTAGQTKQLSATVLPVYADNKSVVWSSSNNSIATVSSGGKVTAKSAGTVTIKATAQDGSGVVGKSVITVKPKPVSTKAKKAKGSITFIWGSSGFLTTVEIYYRVKGSSKWKVARVSGADRKKIKLKRKKTYQFQLRGCKTVKGKNYYSAWTKKTVKS
jgi:uncharacterized protein YjdB